MLMICKYSSLILGMISNECMKNNTTEIFSSPNTVKNRILEKFYGHLHTILSDIVSSFSQFQSKFFVQEGFRILFPLFPANVSQD